MYKEIQNGSGAKSYPASSYMVKYLCISSYIMKPSSYMTLHPIPSKFPYKWGHFFSFLSDENAGSLELAGHLENKIPLNLNAPLNLNIPLNLLLGTRDHYHNSLQI